MSAAVILNGNQVYMEELIRENARLTVRVEAERQNRQELEAVLVRLKAENESLSSRVEQAEGDLGLVAAGLEREKLLISKLDQAIKDLRFVMAGGDACKVCALKCAFGTGECKPVWRGEKVETEEAADQ